MKFTRRPMEYLYENVKDGRKVWAKNQRNLCKKTGCSFHNVQNYWIVEVYKVGDELRTIGEDYKNVTRR